MFIFVIIFIYLSVKRILFFAYSDDFALFWKKNTCIDILIMSVSYSLISILSFSIFYIISKICFVLIIPYILSLVIILLIFALSILLKLNFVIKPRNIRSIPLNIFFRNNSILFKFITKYPIYWGFYILNVTLMLLKNNRIRVIKKANIYEVSRLVFSIFVLNLPYWLCLELISIIRWAFVLFFEPNNIFSEKHWTIWFKLFLFSLHGHIYNSVGNRGQFYRSFFTNSDNVFVVQRGVICKLKDSDIKYNDSL